MGATITKAEKLARGTTELYEITLTTAEKKGVSMEMDPNGRPVAQK